jgi:hypothetical protein
MTRELVRPRILTGALSLYRLSGVHTLSGALTGGPGYTLNNAPIGVCNARDMEIFLSSSFL